MLRMALLPFSIKKRFARHVPSALPENLSTPFSYPLRIVSGCSDEGIRKKEQTEREEEKKKNEQKKN